MTGAGATTTATGTQLLRVDDLVVEYLLDDGPVRAVDGVSFQIAPGESFGLVGESGSGKSTLAHALGRLLPPPAVIRGGRVWLAGQDLMTLSERQLRAVRGRELALVPQSGMNALSPLLSVGAQIANAILAHEPGGAGQGDVPGRVAETLRLVGLPADVAGRFPHELSGGMRQRAVIAIALALRPALVVLDESTAALDMIVQRELLLELVALQARLGFAVLFISHDLPLTLALCQRVGVLYAGRLVETGPAATLARAPLHPYTQGLMRSFVDPRAPRPLELRGISGSPPDLRRLPSGCPFHPRCPAAFAPCPHDRPGLITPSATADADDAAARRQAACHLVT